MFSQFLHSEFWFIQPSSFLSSPDRLLFYVFVGLSIIGIVAAIIRKFLRNKIEAKLASRFFHLFLTTGLLGIIWFAFRYENTQVLGLRYWAALIILAGLVWLGFILKFLVFNFFQELREYRHEAVKNKYIAGSKSR